MVAALNFRRGLPPWWIEVIIVGLGYLLYQAVQILVTGSEESAIDRAEWIWTVQKMLHINPEIVVNQWVANNDFLVYATGYFYGIAHFAVTPLVLIWIRVYRKNDYALLRNVLIGSSLVALLMYWIVPLAPPRLSMTQIVDTLRVENILSAADPTGPRIHGKSICRHAQSARGLGGLGGIGAVCRLSAAPVAPCLLVVPSNHNICRDWNR